MKKAIYRVWFTIAISRRVVLLSRSKCGYLVIQLLNILLNKMNGGGYGDGLLMVMMVVVLWNEDGLQGSVERGDGKWVL